MFYCDAKHSDIHGGPGPVMFDVTCLKIIQLQIQCDDFYILNFIL